MNVAELIAELNKYEPEAEIYILNEVHGTRFYLHTEESMIKAENNTVEKQEIIIDISGLFVDLID